MGSEMCIRDSGERARSALATNADARAADAAEVEAALEAARKAAVDGERAARDELAAHVSALEACGAALARDSEASGGTKPERTTAASLRRRAT